MMIAAAILLITSKKKNLKFKLNTIISKIALVIAPSRKSIVLILIIWIINKAAKEFIDSHKSLNELFIQS